ncbi:MAG: superoxide dismutase [Candidatus Altiarchaeota archaeon]|nr:superoxide dismutase [Candidatus Altiarchaeota archaeon]
MENRKLYSLPDLPYGYDALVPFLFEEQLRIHHDKHHAAYVKGANALLESLEKARKSNEELDYATIAKQLSFNTGGHALHSLFWRNLRTPEEGNEPAGLVAERIDSEYGSFDRFRKEFSQAAAKTEGSGWAVLSYCLATERPIIMQVEKHNVNVSPGRPLLLVLDVWEHAYYLDYKNDRGSYVERFWAAVDWDEVGKRLQDILGGHWP